MAAAAVVAASKRNIGTQSVFRDSEAQTLPYSPDVVLPLDGSKPEVISLDYLTHAKGLLPATLAEVQVIERSRQKREFEKSLPPGTDEFSFNLRARMMEEAEFREWAEREKHIKTLQDRRLTLIMDLLREKNLQIERAHGQKVTRRVQSCEEDKDQLLAAAQRLRVKVLRKGHKGKLRSLTEGGCHPERSWDFSKAKNQRDILQEYINHGSRMYAPKARDGHVPDTNTARIEVQPAELQTYPGLVRLERTLPANLLKVKIPPSAATAAELLGKAPGQGGRLTSQQRRDAHTKEALKRAMEQIKKEIRESVAKEEAQAAAASGGVAGGAIGHTAAAAAEDTDKHADTAAMQGKTGATGGAGGRQAMLERPETPRVKEEFLPEEEDQEAAVLLLRRLIRGRARQNAMFVGKEKRLDLINELRAGERWQEGTREEEEKTAVRELQLAVANGNLESVLGSEVSVALDELSKELVRFQEERRIAAMVRLAERDRRLRQAQESGRRQAEERLREREDIMFRQIMGVHQGTVDSYLEEVLSSTADKAARARALTEAKLRARHVNRVIDQLEAEEASQYGHQSQEQPETDADQQQAVAGTAEAPSAVARGLLGAFLLPHVQRERVRQRIQLEARRFSEAANSALDASMTNAESRLIGRPVVHPTDAPEDDEEDRQAAAT